MCFAVHIVSVYKKSIATRIYCKSQSFILIPFCECQSFLGPGQVGMFAKTTPPGSPGGGEAGESDIDTRSEEMAAQSQIIQLSSLMIGKVPLDRLEHDIV